MDFLFLKRHYKIVAAIFITVAALLTAVFTQGQLKSGQTTDWLDVLGEGGIFVMTAVWLFFLLASRPAGKVTYLLSIGLTCFLCSSLLDLTDEFVSYPSKEFWLYWIESLPALVGMVLMTWGLYQWHHEQLKLHKQLSRREAFYREHSQIDYITQLYSADYMRDHLSQLIAEQQSYALAMLDIRNFADFNRSYSTQDGDRLLREVADLIVMNLRTADLACRYAGDRFIIVMPNTGLAEAQEVCEQIQQAVKSLAFKPNGNNKAVYHKIATAVVLSAPEQQLEQAIRQVNLALEK